MPSLLSLFERIFTSNERLTVEDEAYIDAYVDDALGRPNPFITAADPMIRADSHHHIITIMDFMRQDQYLNPWIIQESQMVRESVIHDPRFALNSILISHL
jgi:hypothetical protein